MDGRPLFVALPECTPLRGVQERRLRQRRRRLTAIDLLRELVAQVAGSLDELLIILRPRLLRTQARFQLAL